MSVTAGNESPSPFSNASASALGHPSRAFGTGSIHTANVWGTAERRNRSMASHCLTASASSSRKVRRPGARTEGSAWAARHKHRLPCTPVASASSVRNSDRSPGSPPFAIFERDSCCTASQTLQRHGRRTQAGQKRLDDRAFLTKLVCTATRRALPPEYLDACL